MLVKLLKIAFYKIYINVFFIPIKNIIPWPSSHLTLRSWPWSKGRDLDLGVTTLTGYLALAQLSDAFIVIKNIITWSSTVHYGPMQSTTFDLKVRLVATLTSRSRPWPWGHDPDLWPGPGTAQWTFYCDQKYYSLAFNLTTFLSCQFVCTGFHL